MLTLCPRLSFVALWLQLEMTPLAYACSLGYGDISRLLLDRGANPHHTDKVIHDLPYCDWRACSAFLHALALLMTWLPVCEMFC